MLSGTGERISGNINYWWINAGEVNNWNHKVSRKVCVKGKDKDNEKCGREGEKVKDRKESTAPTKVSYVSEDGGRVVTRLGRSSEL